jgi:HD superfamily phosphohydrolase
VHHVLDVLEAAERLGKNEKISEKEMELVQVAVLFHDSGFIQGSKNHEQVGCELAKKNLPGFGYHDDEINSICGMIMATAYPQKPKNHLEEIVCDADLDYLGRDDFFIIGNTLLKEMNTNGSVTTEADWNKLQETFLGSHHYFTETANRLRGKKKQEHLEKIKQINRKKIKS